MNSVFPAYLSVLILAFSHSSDAAISCGQPAEKYPPSLSAYEAKPNSWPWMVSIQDAKGQHFCSGTILQVKPNVDASDMILTAADCVVRLNGSTNGLTVSAGMHWKNYTNGVEARKVVGAVSNVFQSWVQPYVNVGVMKLEKPIKFSDTIRPVCIVDEKAPYYSIPTGTMCVAAGWSKYNGEEKNPNALQQAASATPEQSDCLLRKWGDYLYMHLVCGGGLRGSASACNGDLGGMLVCQETNNGRWVQYGVTGGPTRDNFHCEDAIPPRYVSVMNHQKWIAEQIKKMSAV